MKLAHIPKPDPSEKTAEENTIPLAEGQFQDDDELNVYGLDPSSPNYAEEIARLKRLKRQDPELFRKMMSLE